MKNSTEKIWLARPEILGNEITYVQNSFESGWITTAYKEDLRSQCMIIWAMVIL